MGLEVGRRFIQEARLRGGYFVGFGVWLMLLLELSAISVL